jgi:hypothetical protein
MAIIAKNTGGGDYAPMEAGMYVGRCVQMIQVGTISEVIEGKEKKMHKVRLGFEFPTELKVFKEENGEQPFMLSKDYTLSFHEKATLRNHLETWRGKKFTEEEASSFDITKLISVPCMVNVVHKISKGNGKTYAEIGSISPLMKGMICPPQKNESLILSYDDFNYDLFNSLPEFLRKKIESSEEYAEMQTQKPKDDVLPWEPQGDSEAPPF